MATTTAPTTTYGVHSEVGKLRKVMVCKPGLAHLRLTPDNCHDLLFDDVIWVQQAETEHYAFSQMMRERGIDVVEMHDLLTETLGIPEARAWVLDRKINPNSVSPLGLEELRAWLDELPAESSPSDSSVGSRPARCRSRRTPDSRATSIRSASSCHRCPIRCSHGIRAAGSTAASA
jgi:arginine deiminase